MRDPSRDDNETARRIALQLSGIKPLPLPQIPGPFDNRYQFVVRVRVRENASAAGYLDPIYPRAAAAGIAEQPRPLPPILNHCTCFGFKPTISFLVLSSRVVASVITAAMAMTSVFFIFVMSM